MTLTRHVSDIVVKRNTYRVLVGRPEGTPFGMEYLGVCRRIILKWILKM
jgi:hypothetical protein